MAATHTHSVSNARGDRNIRGGPLDEYRRFLAGRIRDAIVRAQNQHQPAGIGWGVGENDRQVFNRRWRRKSGSKELRNPFGRIDQVRMNPPANHPDLLAPAGPVDPLIPFHLGAIDRRRPIALANYSLDHVGGVRGGDISADYFGVFAEQIRRLLQGWATGSVVRRNSLETWRGTNQLEVAGLDEDYECHRQTARVRGGGEVADSGSAWQFRVRPMLSTTYAGSQRPRNAKDGCRIECTDILKLSDTARLCRASGRLVLNESSL